ncbi:MAG: tetratricopeptide repeat protein, partial [Akkermansiaceae bacterium]
MLDDEPPPEYDDAGSDTPPQETEDPAYRKVRIFDHWVDSNRFDQAVDAGLEALADYPDSAYLHSRLGYVFFRLDRNKEAVHHLELARAADPDDAYPRSLLALIHGDSMISKFSKVEKEAFLALRLDPDNYNAWLTLAYSTVSYDEGFALSCCDRLIQL